MRAIAETELTSDQRAQVAAAPAHVTAIQNDHSAARLFRNNLLLWTASLAVAALVLASITSHGFRYVLVGALAGLLTTAVAWRSLTHLNGPYSISIAQALLKISAGAASALLGLLLVRSGIISGLSVTSSSAYGYAVVFSQQAFTQAVDGAAKARRLVAPLDLTRLHALGPGRGWRGERSCVTRTRESARAAVPFARWREPVSKRTARRGRRRRARDRRWPRRASIHAAPVVHATRTWLSISGARWRSCNVGLKHRPSSLTPRARQTLRRSTAAVPASLAVVTVAGRVVAPSGVAVATSLHLDLSWWRVRMIIIDLNCLTRKGAVY